MSDELDSGNDSNDSTDHGSELDHMDAMLSDAMEQIYYKFCGDGRIRDRDAEELRLKMLKAMSTLARTRLQVLEQRELEVMRRI